MSYRQHLSWLHRVLPLAAAAMLALAPASFGASVDVPAIPGVLQAAIAAAAAGDVLELEPGVHSGPVMLDRAITLAGRPGAVIDGQHHGSVVEVTAPGATVRDLTIRASGRNLSGMDAAVFLDASAKNAVIQDNTIQDSLVGVYVHGAAGAIVRANHIAGWNAPNRNDSGNGVYVWDAPGAEVIGNDISGGRDGIFTNISRHNVFRANRIHGTRFAVHYMYTNDSEVSDNISIGNHAGYVIMFSNNLDVRNNLSDHDRDHGMLFNYANSSRITGNAVLHGGKKCVFIYNANRNQFHNNWFEGCEIGVHFTAGSEGNEITGNAFVGNRNQVKYVGTRDLDWSKGGRGNYWSDNPAFDLNGDGVADTAYRPNDLVDRV
ncbi:MAG: nitrous oxide reductase family maturation protein NosD, partial [Rhodospirillales bacterium]|nr:nitrous oxide reductase family maturation protein NosD [Rhodospirillales bacterium]